MRSETPPLLEIDNLSVRIPTEDGIVHAVNGVSLSIGAGETVGVVGESGSGKTMTVMAVARLLPANAHVDGTIRFDGRDVMSMGVAHLRMLRGGDIGITFQDAATFLDPLMRIGDQIAEVVRTHVPGVDVTAEVERMLALVRLPRPRRMASMYPHELSGGMRQRVLMAMALAGRPRLLIADEPTTALDVTIQAQIMDLLRSLQVELGLSVILVTHDLGLVAETCQRVYVMYAGKVMEVAMVDDLFARPEHPYTEGLLASTLSVHERRSLPVSLQGSVPSLLAPPAGCVFHPRCPHVMPVCTSTVPPGYDIAPHRKTYCWLYDPASQKPRR